MLKTTIAPTSLSDGVLGVSSLDAGSPPLPTEGMKAITAICAQSQTAMGEMMRSKPAGLGLVVGGNNGSVPAVTHSISGMNGAALAGLGAALVAASGSSAKKGKEKSGRGTSEPSAAPTAKTAPQAKPATPPAAKPAEKTMTPPPGGNATVPETPTKAPIDPNIYSGFEEPELGKGTKITLGGTYDTPKPAVKSASVKPATPPKPAAAPAPAPVPAATPATTPTPTTTPTTSSPPPPSTDAPSKPPFTFKLGPDGKTLDVESTVPASN